MEILRGYVVDNSVDNARRQARKIFEVSIENASNLKKVAKTKIFDVVSPQLNDPATKRRRIIEYGSSVMLKPITIIAVTRKTEIMDQNQLGKEFVSN